MYIYIYYIYIYNIYIYIIYIYIYIYILYTTLQIDHTVHPFREPLDVDCQFMAMAWGVAVEGQDAIRQAGKEPQRRHLLQLQWKKKHNLSQDCSFVGKWWTVRFEKGRLIFRQTILHQKCLFTQKYIYIFSIRFLLLGNSRTRWMKWQSIL